MKRTTSLLVLVALLSGCGPDELARTSDEPEKIDEQTQRSLDIDEIRKELQEELAVADPVDLPEGTIDPDLVGSWVAIYSVDQEKYDTREPEYRDIVDVMVADMNASKSTFELSADGTYTHSASVPNNPRNPGGSEMAGNTLMRGVWCVIDGDLVMVLREFAYSEPDADLPDPTPINKSMAASALATIELSDDRKSFTEETGDRDSPYYFPMTVMYHKVD